VSGSGSICAFLPAHSASRAGAVAQQLSRTLSESLGVTVLLADFDRRAYSVWSSTEAPKRLDQRTWGAFVSEVDCIPVLNARDVHPRHLARLLDYARRHFHIVCADLTGAGDAHASEILRAANSIFLVTGSDPVSIASVGRKMEWLKSRNLPTDAGLLLEHTPNGITASEAEEQTGVPVCSLVENSRQVDQLANWLALNALAARETNQFAAELATAV
jgi:hypothetical protein